MRQLVAAIFSSLVVLAAAAMSVQAHGEGPGVEIVPAMSEPGETVWLFGEDLTPASPALAELLTASGDRHVSQGRTDDDGHLTLSFVVPDDLAPRVYELRVTDASGLSVSTYLTLLEGETPIDEASWSLVAILLTATVGAAAVIVLNRARARP